SRGMRQRVKVAAAIVNDPERPVQFIFAGKAHPRDEGAKALIREVLHFSRQPEFRDRLVLLERYDVDLARSLVQGADVWLNTPLRPLEASGTSGMKSVANGGLHMSVLDGWWWEAYRPGLGWAVGRDRVDDDPEVQDAFDANSIYDLLENELVPAFYDRDSEGIPQAWVRRMKDSIAAFGPVFNTSRMVAEYATTAYGPAAASWNRLLADDLREARDVSQWLEHVIPAWPAVKVLSVDDDASEGRAVGEPIGVSVQVHPGQLQPEDIRVDVVHGQTRPGGDLPNAETVGLERGEAREDGVCTFNGSFTAAAGGRVGYAVRVLPTHPALHHPLATGLAIWA
ncbi:MAG TPA: alpha-glucan family phosphorylase, partial [Tepidiformaceae bacterium]|nr:alpha-glucan family phosphorylase [Tepidiformaceae bacterium]